MDTFWEGGGEAYARGLREHYEPRLQLLRDQCAQCTDDAARTQLDAERTALEQEYAARLEEIDKLLF